MRHIPLFYITLKQLAHVVVKFYASEIDKTSKEQNQKNFNVHVVKYSIL